MKLLKIISLTFGGFLLVLSILVTLIWFYPGIFITSKSFRWVYNVWLDDTISMTWDSNHLQAKSLSFWKKRLGWRSKDLCMNVVDSKPFYCFSKIDIEIVFDFQKDLPFIEEVKRLIVHSDQMHLSLRNDLKQKEERKKASAKTPVPDMEKISSYLQRADAFLREFQWNHVEVHLPDFALFKGKQTIFNGSLLLNGKNSEALRLDAEVESPYAIEANVHFERGNNNQDVLWKVNAQAKINPVEKKTATNWKIVANHNFIRPSQGKLLETQGRIQFNFYSEDGHHKLNSEQRIILDAYNLHATVDALLDPSFPPMTHFKMDNCQLTMLLSEADRGETDLSCHIETHWLWNEKLYLREDLDVLNWYLSAKIDLAEFLKSEGNFQLALRLKPVRTDFLHLDTNLELKGRGGINTSWTAWNLEPFWKLQMLIPKFQKWVDKFKSSPWPVPAPLNDLNGSVEITTHVDPRELKAEDGWRVPMRAQTRLQNSRQKVLLDFESHLYVPAKFENIANYKIDGRLTIQDLALQVPPIDPIQGVPQILPDARFRSIEKEEQSPAVRAPASVDERNDTEGLPFPINIHIATTNSKSIRIFYYLISPYIGAGLDLNLDFIHRPSGNILLKDFQINYLKREAQIYKANFELHESPLMPTNVDVLAKIDVDIYRVYIQVLGTLESPELTLWSEPSLSRGDIISLLLYNRLRTDLSSGEAENVSSVESAYADKAIGLFGLWVLASTPIERIAYNPNTKMYSATVQVSEGTSVSIGGDWEQIQALELKRRLAKNWYLMTLFRPGETSEGNVFLEWQQRFGK